MAKKILIKIGWREWLGMHGLGLPLIKAKIDTGARTSSLHAFDIKPFTKDGADWVRFKVHPLQGKRSPVITCEAPVKDRRHVTDSGSHRELRYVIETQLSIADQNFTIDITLTNRELMRFKMLLGREAMKNRAIVFPGKSFLLGKYKKIQALTAYNQ